MRADAANLLARLKRTDIRYRVFNESFADIDLWPIFEAVLMDERIIARSLPISPTRVADNIETQRHPAVQAHQHAPFRAKSATGAGSAAIPLTHIDSGSNRLTDRVDVYGATGRASDSPVPGDLKVFLGRLSVQHDGHGG